MWERDPGAPVGYEGHLMDVAFAPGSAERGYAVGKGGALLSYGKSWTQEAVPAGYGSADFTQIAFAGGQALVAASRVARATRTCSSTTAAAGASTRARTRCCARFPARSSCSPSPGLPDGGAVAAGRDVVLIRDSAGLAVAVLRPAAAGLDGDRGGRDARRRPGAPDRLGRAVP